MNTPLVSVIVPVYKAEKYLHKCVDSLLAQTMTDFEVLLIDDGSPDRSGAICDEYAAKDSRIRVFHKENGGVSSARNLGLDNALGEWITFVDSDDWVEMDYLYSLYNPTIKNENIDFVQMGCTNYIEGEILDIEQKYDFFVGEDKYYIFNYFRGLTCSKFFKKDIILKNRIKFDEKMKIAEDMTFSLDYILYVNCYCFVSEVGYYYRRDNENSATKNNNGHSYEIASHSFFHFYDAEKQYILKHKLDKDKIISKRYEQLGESFFSVLKSLYNDCFSFKARIDILKSDFNINHFELLKYVNRSWLCKSILCKMLVNRYFVCFDLLFNGFTLVYKILR